ncbi:hypothetical protein DEI86_04695 [Curtobacterium sp. MCBD17_028]|nr:hypothetical protein DEI86_04695 [Curtobacterium sp. MCBD17_028]
MTAPTWLIVGKDISSETSGGLNSYVRGLSEAVRGSGRGLRLLLVARGPIKPETDTSLIRGGAAVRIWRFFLAGYRSGPVDVLNVHFAMYAAPFLVGHAASRALRRRPRTKVVFNYHGPWALEAEVAGSRSRLKLRLMRTMERACGRMADQIVVLSNEFARGAVEHLRVVPEKVHRVAPGLDERFAARATAHADRPEVHLVCVRRLTRRMGHLRLLEALEQVDFLADGRPVVLHVVGGGEQEGAIEHWVTEHERQANVVLHGRVPDDELLAVVDASDVAVVPTESLEGFGLVVIEAMARGLPVISTGQGGLREAMGPWARAPYLFDLGDPVQLSAAIRAAAAADPAERSALREYALGFSWSRVVREIEEIAGCR